MRTFFKHRLNLRDLGGIATADGSCIPHGLFLRSGKLSVLTRKQCARLCRAYNIRCVIDLRTGVEAAEFPDPLPDGVEYVSVPLFESATIGITHETGSDPMAIIRSLRRNPEKLKVMVPDFEELYRRMVADPWSRQQLDTVVAMLSENMRDGRCTLFHCTAGKDRTGVVSMALLRKFGVRDQDIVQDYLRTNRNAFLPALGKSIGIFLMTGSLEIARTVYKAYMAHRHLIEIAINEYSSYSFASE